MNRDQRVNVCKYILNLTNELSSKFTEGQSKFEITNLSAGLLLLGFCMMMMMSVQLSCICKLIKRYKSFSNKHFTHNKTSMSVRIYIWYQAWQRSKLYFPLKTPEMQNGEVKILFLAYEIEDLAFPENFTCFNTIQWKNHNKKSCIIHYIIPHRDHMQIAQNRED